MTSRDLYLAIEEIGRRFASSDRTLEQYLLSLLGAARPYRDQAALTAAEFLSLLSDAFTAAPLVFDGEWRERYDALDGQAPGFAGWKATLVRQIVDLREMDETGVLRNEMRYFGVPSPRGEYWYNFSPLSYLECATAGSVGGWEPGDPTGRRLVPGQVAVLDAEGNLQSVDAQDIERPVLEMVSVGWEDFQYFLVCGQTYE